MRVAFLCLLSLTLLLSSCATPQVVLPAGVASLMYANARADYATAKVLVIQACTSGKMDKAACETAKGIDIRAQIYRTSIEGALMNPQAPIDWAQVMAYTAGVAEILLKVGLIP